MTDTTTQTAVDKLRWLIGNRPDDGEVTVHVADLRAVLAVVEAAADLARDIAQMWGPAVSLVDAATGTIRKDWPGLAAALDRLAGAYGETP